MNAFQWISISAASCFVLLLAAGLATRRLRARTALPWMVLWIAAAVTIARPGITVAVANALGIARGADLVSYVAILSGLVAFFVMYARLRRTEAALTALVRHVALSEARDETTASRSDA